MRSSFCRSTLNSPSWLDSRGGARRHPHPSIDVPRAGRRAPARLSTSADNSSGLTHTNSSPTNPGWFNAPSTGTFVTACEMTAGRGGHTATLLKDGTVLIAGGYCFSGGGLCGVYASAELYTPPVLVTFPMTQAPSTGIAGSASVTASQSFGWSATSNAPWLVITSGGSGTGNGTIQFTIRANTSLATRTATVTIAGQAFSVKQPPAILASLGSSDFDGDHKADIGVYRHASGQWFIAPSSGGSQTVNWGAPSLGDVPVPGDYDGDGKADNAVYRSSTGQWFIFASKTGTTMQVSWGAFGDIPVPANYDGDGTTDIAVFRTTTGEWFILQSQSNTMRQATWGAPSLGDVPVPADYDGDGKADIGVYRTSSGQWFILASRSNTLIQLDWGAPSLGDVPVPADYDGDGVTDVGIYRTSTGEWIVHLSGGVRILAWGAPS